MEISRLIMQMGARYQHQTNAIDASQTKAAQRQSKKGKMHKTRKTPLTVHNLRCCTHETYPFPHAFPCLSSSLPSLIPTPTHATTLPLTCVVAALVHQSRQCVGERAIQCFGVCVSVWRQGLSSKEWPEDR